MFDVCMLRTRQMKEGMERGIDGGIEGGREGGKGRKEGWRKGWQERMEEANVSVRNLKRTPINISLNSFSFILNLSQIVGFFFYPLSLIPILPFIITSPSHYSLHLIPSPAVPTTCWMKEATHLTITKEYKTVQDLHYWYADCHAPAN